MSPWVSSTQLNKNLMATRRVPSPRPALVGTRAGGALGHGLAGAAPSYGAAERALEPQPSACAQQGIQPVRGGRSGTLRGEVAQGS